MVKPKDRLMGTSFQGDGKEKRVLRQLLSHRDTLVKLYLDFSFFDNQINSDFEVSSTMRLLSSRCQLVCNPLIQTLALSLRPHVNIAVQRRRQTEH